MGTTASRMATAAAALAFGVFGLWTTVDPVGALQTIDVQTTGPDGVTELRAMYGGLELGVAGFLAACAVSGSVETVRIALKGAVAFFAGLGGMRLVGMLLVPPEGTQLFLLVSAEASAVAIGLAALWWDRAP